MKKALILTLGFDEKFCYRAILRHGLKEGDKIILITASLVDKVKEAYEWIKKFIEKSYGRDIGVELIEINVKNLEESFIKIIKKLKELEGYEIILNLSGGMRALLAIVLISLTLYPIRNIKIEIELEDFSGIVEIPQEFFQIKEIGAKLAKERREILLKIKEGCFDVKSLSKSLKKDESTIRRHIYVLNKLGLVEITRKKPMKIKLSKLGEILLPR